MTTPTPDQGALERARDLATTIVGNVIPRNERWEYVRNQIAAALTAAASEARAAAIAECAQCAETISFDPARRIHPDIPFKGMSEQAQRIAHSTAQTIAADIRALATPAQSEGK